MLTIQQAKGRALRRAVSTGQMVDMALVHRIQKTEGNPVCFGLAEAHCDRVTCRWHSECMALLEVKVVSDEPIFA
jgi:hypothetical protein